jgi:hypothetical protein
MKNSFFWDVAPCRFCVNRYFGGTYRVHLQDLSTLNLEEIRSSETSVHRRSIRRHIPEDGILHQSASYTYMKQLTNKFWSTWKFFNHSSVLHYCSLGIIFHGYSSERSCLQ